MTRITAIWTALMVGQAFADKPETIDLSQAVVVVRGDSLPEVEQTAATMLVEEVAKRTGITWRRATQMPNAPAIVVGSDVNSAAWSRSAPQPLRQRWRTVRRDGYLVTSQLRPGQAPVVWVLGADERGALFGVGHLLRLLELSPNSARLTRPVDVATAPAYRLRGHQLGYRNRANSYDAWNVQQFEQYIRDLVVFGANAVENIPFEDESKSPHMRVPRPEMNVRISEICRRYGIEYWAWTPATIDLGDAQARRQLLDLHDDLYASCPRVDGIFVPGGDPGQNHPRLVMPFLEDIAGRLLRRHPHARVWLSLQGFNTERVDYVFEYLKQHQPKWFGGIVHGPSSPNLKETRRRLAHGSELRHYPDITHCVRCQYPVPWWDPAFAFTLGREPINPRPVDQAMIHNALAPFTAGFISYSDGVHDDVNKIIWTQMGWDPRADVREILVQYARYFFGPGVALHAADGILALERNWHGSLATNGGVDATLVLWQALEAKAPELTGNWRWQQCLLRAYYDAYTRHRLLYESRLEDEVNVILAQAPQRGADSAINAAVKTLARADTEKIRLDLRRRIEVLCDSLFQSIGLQTSVPRYGASGAERGAVLDSLDHPLNNRWWLEDQFAAIRKLPGEADKLARLEQIRTWEDPGPGSFYDDIGHVGKSPHVIRGEGLNTDPTMRRNPNADFWDAHQPRSRLSWISKMDWPLGLRYDGLDPAATYIVRTTGFRDAILSIDGKRVHPTRDGKGIGEFKEFPVPKESLADGALLLTWEEPLEPELNWRVQSRLTEVWLLRQ
jgi:hypothetical protein